METYFGVGKKILTSFNKPQCNAVKRQIVALLLFSLKFALSINKYINPLNTDHSGVLQGVLGDEGNLCLNMQTRMMENDNSIKFDTKQLLECQYVNCSSRVTSQ